MIIDQLRIELKLSIKSNNSQKRDDIRLLLGECERINANLTDEEVLSLVKKLIKKEEEVLALTKADSSSFYLLLKSLLPEAASAEEIKEWIDQNVDFSKLKSKNQAIGMVLKHFGNKTDGQKVKSIIFND